MKMFNLDELVEMDVAYVSAIVVDWGVEEIRGLLTNRHRGTDGFIITTLASHVGGVG